MTEILKKFENFIFNHLNSEQKSAVTPQNGSFLVIAGAGSGKTRVITARIAHLILYHNIDPSSIIALTFTNKAAQEMLHRIEQFLPNLKTKPIIATFHAYCLKLLKKNIHLLELQQFSVIDSDDSIKLLQSILKEKGCDKLFNAKQLLPMFSTMKMNSLLGIDEPLWNMHHAQEFMHIFNAYQQQKKLNNYMDFDDLLYQTFHLFKTQPNFRQKHLETHRHILVDEYQDTNIIQHELLKQITLQDKKLMVDSVCAVGDEDQSIYSWRGATVKNILDFNQEFFDTKIIKLEQNYRSTQQILDVANSIIKHNIHRNHKNLWSQSSQQHQPLQLECLSDLQEAHAIAHLIQLISKTEKKSSIAILYRTHYQSRIIEEALIKEAIPYKMIGGIQFYERKEIKDLLAYLRLILNPFDRIAFFRIINCPLRGLGEKFEELFMQIWNLHPFSPFQEIANIIINQKLIATKQTIALQEFISIFDIAQQLILASDQKSSSVVTILEFIIKKTDYYAYLINSFDKQDAHTKRENVSEFLRAAHFFDENSKAGLSQFLDEISLMQEQSKHDETATDRVNMMTLHSAKGLEFATVILAGLEEGILPSNQSIGQENVEEERRLFYVGITRAQKKLMITHSKYRNVFGKMEQQRPSRFLSEIPHSLIQSQEATHWSKSGFITFFETWIYNKASTKKITPVTTIAQPVSVNSDNFKRLQSVHHAIFGTGIAHNIETKGNKTFVTVYFTKHGTKKIESSFLKII